MVFVLISTKWRNFIVAVCRFSTKSSWMEIGKISKLFIVVKLLNYNEKFGSFFYKSPWIFLLTLRPLLRSVATEKCSSLCSKIENLERSAPLTFSSLTYDKWYSTSGPDHIDISFVSQMSQTPSDGDRLRYIYTHKSNEPSALNLWCCYN